jgi:hypothetical protein
LTTTRRAVALALLLLALRAGPAAAQEGPLSQRAGSPAEQWRPQLRLDGVLRDRALLEALRSALPLRFHIRVEMWRRTSGPDRLVAARENARALLRTPLEEGYTLDDGRTQHRCATLPDCELALERAFQPPLRPEPGGRYYYVAILSVQTLSTSDLDELRRWLRGEAQPAVTGDKPVGRAVESGLRRFFVRLLGLPTRRYQATSGSFDTAAEE